MKIPEGFVPIPPNISFLLTFNFSQLLQHSPDFYLLQRKYQNFSWGLCPQTPSYLLPVYIKLLPHLYPTYQHPPDFHSLQRKFQKFSWGLRLHTPSYILNSLVLTFNFSPLYILPINIHQTLRFLLNSAQMSKIFPDPSYLLPVYIQLLPLIYPSYQYSPDPKISPHYRANIKNFPGGFAPRVQTPTNILPAYMQLCPQTPS